MAVLTFNMPKSRIEPLASQTPGTEADLSSDNSAKQNNSSSQQEPPASRKPMHKAGITFAAQDRLPKLPIPELDSTCNKYLNALKPLQSHREHEETAVAVQEFLKNEGPELQTRLKNMQPAKPAISSNFVRSHLFRVYR